MKTKKFTCPKCGGHVKVTANYFFIIDGEIEPDTGKIGKFYKSNVIKSPCNDEFKCPSCGILEYKNGEDELNNSIFKLYQDLVKSTGTNENILPFEGEFDVIKKEHLKNFKNIIKNFRRPEGRPYIFFEEAAMDGECVANCCDWFNYDDARKEQLRDIKETVYHNLQLDIKNDRKITIQLIKRKLVEYRRYYIEEFDLESGSTVMKWLNYWCIQFLLTLREEDLTILYQRYQLNNRTLL